MLSIGAYEAKTKLSELLDRAEKGEIFEITKNGRPVAKLVPIVDPSRADALAAAERLRAWLAESPRPSEEEAQRNWEDLKRELAQEDDERTDGWLSSSTPR